MHFTAPRGSRTHGNRKNNKVRVRTHASDADRARLSALTDQDHMNAEEFDEWDRLTTAVHQDEHRLWLLGESTYTVLGTTTTDTGELSLLVRTSDGRKRNFPADWFERVDS